MTVRGPGLWPCLLAAFLLGAAVTAVLIAAEQSSRHRHLPRHLITPSAN